MEKKNVQKRMKNGYFVDPPILLLHHRLFISRMENDSFVFFVLRSSFF